MKLANRYAAILTRPDGFLREAPGEALEEKSELELQAHWYAGDFGSSFQTATTGERVEIVQFGVWNRESGPDFSDAAVRFADRPEAPVLRGAIELDTHAEDWDRHGHGSNPAFDAVVLHLYLRRGSRQPFTRTSGHRQVAQVQLDLRQLEQRPPLPAALPLTKAGRCMAPLRALDPDRVQQVLAAAAQYRLEIKNRRWQRLAAARGFDEALFQSLAVTLGYKENKLPFALLAQRLPLKLLRSEPQTATAFLLGLGGFLHAPEFGQDPAIRETRSYLGECWEHWWRRRSDFDRLILPRSAWKLTGLRPANHPQRRLAALGQLAGRGSRMRRLINTPPGSLAGDVREFLSELHDPYWDHHYTLTSARAEKPVALIGAARATEILANVFFPLAISTNPAHWAEYESLPAALTNRRVETAAGRLFGDTASHRELWLKTVVHQQGLLQIYEDFCLQDDSDCERCTFPERVRGFEFRTP